MLDCRQDTVPGRREGTIETALAWGARCLKQAGIPRAREEAGILLAHLLGVHRPVLFTQWDRSLDHKVRMSFQSLCRRRAEGEPCAYLVGVKEFWSLDFVVNASVLVPRPETEHLVEAILELCPEDAPLIADVGTGSGCVGLALAHERPKAWVLG
ncbi:MAG: N5-glutamine methyltransferase family protein, partial [Acidobacteriota bacterium]